MGTARIDVNLEQAASADNLVQVGCLHLVNRMAHVFELSQLQLQYLRQYLRQCLRRLHGVKSKNRSLNQKRGVAGFVNGVKTPCTVLHTHVSGPFVKVTLSPCNSTSEYSCSPSGSTCTSCSTSGSTSSNTSQNDC